MSLFRNIFLKSQYKYCPHGYPIASESKLPHIRTVQRIEVCRDCAVQSSLTQMGSGIVLDKEVLAELCDKIKIIREKNGKKE